MAPSDQAKNKVWDQIKVVNPNWEQELTCDITVDQAAAPAPAQNAAATQPERTYTVEAGDSLSKISKQFYGDANNYMKIFQANQDVLSDPNMIKPGQTLKIPA